MIEKKDLIIFAMSFVSLFVSLSTLYLTQLSDARIQMMAGEHLNIGHYSEGNLNISLPVTLVNHGARTAIVRRVALLIQEPGNSEGYLMEPLYFQKLDDKGGFLHDSMPAPIGIPSKQNVTKQVLFGSSVEHPDEFQITGSGTLNLTLLGWRKNAVNPDMKDAFSIVVSNEDAAQLESSLKNKSGSTRRIPQSVWRNWNARRLTEFQIKGLIP
jgi:hypothetical protein